MKAHYKVFSVERMAKVLNVSKSGYYAWLSRSESKQKKEQRRLDVLVKAAYETNQGRYGSRKISHYLMQQGHPYSRSRVAIGLQVLNLKK